MFNQLKGIRFLLKQRGKSSASVPEVDVAHTLQAIASGSVQILDVREENEWQEGRMPNAIHIPLGDLERRTGELDINRPVIAVCRSGRRSLMAAEALLNTGFSEAASLAGGILAWSKANQPLER